MLDHIRYKPNGTTPAMWDAWQEWKKTYNSKLRYRLEKYDPEKHLPKLFKETLTKQGIDYERKDLDFAEQEAMNDGRGYLTPTGHVMINYEKQLAHDGKTHIKKHYVDDPLDALIKQASAREDNTM